MSADRSGIDYSQRLWVRVWLIATLIFLYAPIIVMIAYSFNDSKRNIVWRGFTFDYYVKAAQNASLIEAFTNSLIIAIIATVLATIIGTLTAVLLWRFRFPGRAAFDGVTTLPIVVPEICMGVSLLVFFNRIGMPTGMPWPLNLSPIILGHVLFCFPFVAVVVRARLEGFDRSLIEASQDLGAKEWQTFFFVIVPHMKPGLIAGALLAMTLSLDDFVITFFTSGPDTLTFPVKVYSMVRFGATPEVNAASTALIVITVILTLTAMKIQSPAQSAKS